MIIVAFAVGVLTGSLFGFAFFRSGRSYDDGFRHGERYGRADGYRQAWLKRNKPLLDAETENWKESYDE